MFSDASEKAYEAAIYAVLRCDDAKSCRLMASRTRVAPVKSLCLPEQGLFAAILGVNFLETVHRVLVVLFDERLSHNRWTDSTTVLSWLSKPASSLQTFIRNIISEIQSFLSFEKWHHVASDENLADIGTRGVSAGQNCIQFLVVARTTLVIRNIVLASLSNYFSWCFPNSNRRGYCSNLSNQTLSIKFSFSRFLQIQ